MKKIKAKKSQRGATLIVVLVMLVLLTLVGLWAIRGSITSLKISTNAQVVALLKQTSDSVFFTLENKTDDELVFTNMRIGDGMLNYTIRPENKGKELVFCVRGQTVDNFVGSRIASVIYWQGTTIKNSDMGKSGFCQVGRVSDYLSGRNAVLTQVSVRAAEGNRDWEHLMEGDDKETSKSTGIQNVVITSTSLLPKLSQSTEAEVNACLSEYTSFKDNIAQNQTVTDCLAGLNVPYSTQEMEYTMKPVRAS